MQHLTKPKADVKAMYADCISNYRDPALLARLQNAAPHVAQASVDYDAAASSGRAIDIESSSSVGQATAAEMVAVYNNKMVAKGQPGRTFYDKLRAGARRGICPLCGHRDATTLDHYLDKAIYPALAVSPYNLVPACRECNSAKMVHRPNCVEDQTLHPYYDLVEDETWLHARVLEVSPPVVDFEVKAPPYWADIVVARLNTHVRVFGLRTLYKTYAAGELVGIARQLERLSARTRLLGLHERLRESAESWLDADLNCWQAAFYSALADSKWFCTEGFSLIRPRS